MAARAYDRRVFRGVTLNERTIAMILTAEKQLGFTLALTQGSYRPKTEYSGTTHMGGGAVDISVSGMSFKRQIRVVKALRDVGFAAWRRPYIEGLWPVHIHAVAIGDRETTAQWQIDEYYAGGDGLTGSYQDPLPYRPKPIPVFDYQAYVARQAELRQLARLREGLAKLVRELNGLKNRIASKRDDIEKLRKH